MRCPGLFYKDMKTWFWLLLAGGALLYLVKTGRLGAAAAGAPGRGTPQTGGGGAVASQGVVPGLINTADAAYQRARKATTENVAQATTDIFGAATGVWTAVKSSGVGGFLSGIFRPSSKTNPATSSGGAGAAVSRDRTLGAIGDSVDSSNSDMSGAIDSPDITGASDVGSYDYTNVNEVSGYDTGSETDTSLDTAGSDTPDGMLY